MAQRKKFVFALVLVLVLFALCIGGGVMLLLRDKPTNVEAFDVSEYQYYIDNFPAQDELGDIIDTEDLLKKVETIWIKIYGEEIKSQKPYQVFYDEKNSIWLVHGTLQFDMMGGVANILVDNDTGKALAIWHDK